MITPRKLMCILGGHFSYRSGANGVPRAPALVPQPLVVQLVALLQVDHSVAHLRHIDAWRLLCHLNDKSCQQEVTIVVSYFKLNVQIQTCS